MPHPYPFISQRLLTHLCLYITRTYDHLKASSGQPRMVMWSRRECQNAPETKKPSTTSDIWEREYKHFRSLTVLCGMTQPIYNLRSPAGFISVYSSNNLLMKALFTDMFPFPTLHPSLLEVLPDIISP